MLDYLTTAVLVDKMPNVKATLLIKHRVVLSEHSFAELFLWELPEPLAESLYNLKYCLAYLVCGKFALRLDKEAGKGVHVHVRGRELAYSFV